MTPGWTHPAFLTEGLEVVVPFLYKGERYGLKCRVLVACGDAGRVVNKKYGVDRWVDRYEMAVPVKNHNE